MDGTISLFSAEASGPGLADLAGVLCGPGRMTGFGRTAARLSAVVDEPWRAGALARECRRRGAEAQVSAAECGRPLVRTPFRVDLLPLEQRWNRGEEKVLPEGFRLDGAMLRMWALAAGSPQGNGYLLALDPEAPETHERLITALAQLGVRRITALAQLGVPAKAQKGEEALLRVTGRRRLAHVLELIGDAPAGAEPAWPSLVPVVRAV
ncbi:hypothetical protein SAMN04489729_5536 [Amycolatopsis lurida]|uniref:Uncharacterized protein n=1 Tax=Amycolatopsis lurida NRRL 2430 TaxID=1460371 RepID=A0A2P2FVN0_AMYLU|nr:hypothetical protein BB31_12635 [Amycolatopsis lurida NRRL 2430]SED86451.1 hypothetical protein SAMN04489729_5536 [Amycolatopsis lurida]